MSQKKETIVLTLSLLVTLLLVGIGGWWLLPRLGIQLGQGSATQQASNRGNAQQPVGSRISFGEKTLLPGEVPSDKRAGMEAIANQNPQQAVSSLESALRTQRNDPESRIFLNNAQIGNQTSYTLAVVVPVSTDLDGSLEILRGVAQAQAEVNQAGGINGTLLRVAIANDDNDPATAKQIANALAKNQGILGVIGHYASDVTLAAAEVYQEQQLVAISPISTAVKLSGFGRYIFRTVPSDYVAARALADYMLNRLRQNSAAVFFNSQSGYSQSLKSEFGTALALGGGQVIAEFDLSDSSFSAARSVEQAIKQGATTLVLAANTGTLDKALQVVQVNRKRYSLLAGDDLYAPKTLEVGGQEAEGMVVAVPWHIAGRSTSARFPDQARQLWGGDVNWRTALTYDATQALIAALRRNPTRAGVQKALAAPDFSATGASGTVRFLPSGDRNASVQLVRVAPGERSGTGYDFVPVP